MDFGYKTKIVKDCYIIQEKSTGNTIEINKVQAEHILNKNKVNLSGDFSNLRYSINEDIVTIENYKDGKTNLLKINISDLRGIIYNAIGVINTGGFISYNYIM